MIIRDKYLANFGPIIGILKLYFNKISGPGRGKFKHFILNLSMPDIHEVKHVILFEQPWPFGALFRQVIYLAL